MARGIMIFGPSGSGKTTLGRAVAERLGFDYIDIDDCIWRKDTEKPFSALYPRQERIARVMAAVQATEYFVMAGSMDSFHEYFDPYFDLAVHLVADTQLRVQRVHTRESDWFGARVEVGGDMYEDHRRNLENIALYDIGGGSTSYAVHKAWADSLKCPVLTLDGGEEIDKNVQTILDAYSAIK